MQPLRDSAAIRLGALQAPLSSGLSVLCASFLTKLKGGSTRATDCSSMPLIKVCSTCTSLQRGLFFPYGECFQWVLGYLKSKMYLKRQKTLFGLWITCEKVRLRGLELLTHGLGIRVPGSMSVYQCLFRAQKQRSMSTEDYQNLPISIGVAVTSAVKTQLSDSWTGACSGRYTEL